jgi:hypothetical protein
MDQGIVKGRIVLGGIIEGRVIERDLIERSNYREIYRENIKRGVVAERGTNKKRDISGRDKIGQDHRKGIRAGRMFLIVISCSVPVADETRYVETYFMEIEALYLVKGTVQRDLRGVKSGINR